MKYKWGRREENDAREEEGMTGWIGMDVRGFGWVTEFEVVMFVALGDTAMPFCCGEWLDC